MIEHLLHMAFHKLVEEGVEKITDKSSETNYLDEKLIQIMNTSKVCLYFYSYVADWLGFQCENDCVTYFHKTCSQGKPERLEAFKRAFAISNEELILFTRDTSFWSTCNQGLVLTNQAMYIVKDNNERKNMTKIYWKQIYNVKCKTVVKDKISSCNYCFYGQDQKEIICLDEDYFFKLRPRIEFHEKLAEQLLGLAENSRL